MFLRCIPPFDQANPFAYNFSCALHVSFLNCMLDQGAWGEHAKSMGESFQDYS